MPDRDLDEIVARMLDGDEQSRRDFLRRLGGTGLAFSGSAAFLAACGGVKGSGTGDKQQSTKVSDKKVPIGNWTFSNWPLYIDKKVLKDFDAKYGGHVKYVEEINDNYDFLSKVRQQLVAGDPIGRDIVTLTDYMANTWIKSGWTRAYDKKNTPNVQKNLEDNLKNISYDPNRDYSVPWQSGGTIIGYNPKLTGRKLHSIKDLFDPKFKGKVTFLSEAYDSAGLVLLMQGKDPTKAKLDDMLEAIDVMDKAQKKGQIRRFTGNDYTTDLTKGNAWVSMAYSGDLVQLKADNPQLEYLFPEEGGMLFTDNMMIPEKAAHPYAAETMMNYVYDPQVAAKIAAYVNYIPPVKGVKEVIAKTDPKTANNPLIFPSAALRAKLHAYPSLSSADERKMRARMAEVTGG